MKVTLIRTGKSHFAFAEEGARMYAERLKHYCRYEEYVLELPARLKSADAEMLKKNEAELILKKIAPTDFVVLLDEKGKTYSSIQFASQLEKLRMQHASIVFIIGGAYGFHESVYERGGMKISLSALTFSHQIVPLIFTEQLYRAFSILKGEQYHHE